MKKTMLTEIPVTMDLPMVIPLMTNRFTVKTPMIIQDMVKPLMMIRLTERMPMKITPTVNRSTEKILLGSLPSVKQIRRRRPTAIIQIWNPPVMIRPVERTLMKNRNCHMRNQRLRNPLMFRWRRNIPHRRAIRLSLRY